MNWITTILEYDPNYPLNRPVKEEGSSIWLILLSVLGVIVIVGGIVFAGFKYFSNFKGRKEAKKLGTFMLQALLSYPNISLTCGKCNQTFPNWSRDRFKIEPVGNKSSIISLCCSVPCYYYPIQVMISNQKQSK